MIYGKKHRPLLIYTNGELMGTWDKGPRGEHILAYAPTWRASPQARPLSLSLPFLPGNQPHRGDAVQAYFENLLPDNIEILRRVQARFAAPSTSAFDLLSEIGRDCVGAIQILPEDQPVPDVRQLVGVPLTESEIAQLLRDTVAFPGRIHTDHDEFRISIAGAQEKTALLYHNNQWMRPRGTTPSTHILKLPIGPVSIHGVDLSLSPENEWLCGQILNAYGLPVPKSIVKNFEDQRVLIVTRFDRSISPDATWIIRLPVEDFCQATATPPGRKYESDGGPGISEIMDILRASRANSDRQTFLKAQVVMWMLAAIDGHAKNFSIHLEADNQFRLAPLYDVISAWPVTGHGQRLIPVQRLRMAMAVTGKNRHYRWHTITARHWIETARRNGIPTPAAKTLLNHTIEQTDPAIQQVISRLPVDFPEPLAQTIFQGLRSSAELLQTTMTRSD